MTDTASTHATRPVIHTYSVVLSAAVQVRVLENKLLHCVADSRDIYRQNASSLDHKALIASIYDGLAPLDDIGSQLAVLEDRVQLLLSLIQIRSQMEKQKRVFWAGHWNDRSFRKEVGHQPILLRLEQCLHPFEHLMAGCNPVAQAVPLCLGTTPSIPLC